MHGVNVADLALTSPVPCSGLHTPMPVSGAGAERYAELVTPLGAAVTVEPGAAGAASSRKLLRSSSYKRLAATFLKALAAAEAAGCADWLCHNTAVSSPASTTTRSTGS